ncbi:hypothetical protein PF008_g20045 [Phytophthora fragariae]|uniref:catechol O-methyltransferase n=1 Tax=Phytophthora fragariae TaxID=53985 RepID=A0A6G0R0V5_9STRA|nr:hypothetical protein PF008_g20045 [Phytophthora fragariae]
MKFLKSLFRKTPRDGSDNASDVAMTGTLPPIDLSRTTRPVRSEGNGEKKPRVGKITLYMLLSDMKIRSTPEAVVGPLLKLRNATGINTQSDLMMRAAPTGGSLAQQEPPALTSRFASIIAQLSPVLPMSTPQKTFKPWWGDGPRPIREEMDRRADEASAKCLEYVKKHAESGNPASVVACIDEFASRTHMMNVGHVKGNIIDEEIRKKKPLVMAELGGYTGYSAVRFASKQREVAGNKHSHYFSFEYSPVFAARVREMVEFAGLTDQVTVYVDAFSEQYEVLRGKTVDMYFIDHEKSVYLSDLKLIIGSEALAPGSVVIADNVGLGAFQGVKNEYLEFVEASPQFSEVRHTVYMKREDMMVPDLSVATFLA